MNQKVEGQNLMKDQYSNAILSTDREKLEAHKNLKKSKRIDHERISKLELEVRQLRELVLNLINKIS